MPLLLFVALLLGSPAITLEDLLSVEPLGAPLLSPDGKTLALTRDGQILLMPATGGWPVLLTSSSGGKSDLSWSPDCRKLAFVSQGGIWIVPVAGGPPRRLTSAPPGPGDPRTASDRAPEWSPSGKWILFETGRRGQSDLMVVSEDGLVEATLTSSDADEGSAAWSPDGSCISYTERAPKYFSGKLKVLPFDPATGRPGGGAREIHEAPADRGGGWSIGRARWSPNGKSLAVVLQTSGWDKLYLIPSAGGAPRPLTDGDSEDGDPVFSPDGKWLAFTSNRTAPMEQRIWLAPVEGGAPRRLVPSASTPGVEGDPQWSSDGSKIYFSRATPLESPALLVASVKGETPPEVLVRTLPRNFEAAGFRLPEAVRYKSKDGLDVEALLYRPSGFKEGTRYPTVLWVHGGPEGKDVFDWDPWALFLTQEGYVVLESNYRGSRGYGERFRNLNVEDSGGGELEDVVAGARFLVDRGIADSDRLAIGGGSHGGTMVAYAVTKQPDLFKAAIELYGVVNRETFLERTNRSSAVRWMMKMGGPPREKPDVYRKANVLLDVARIKTPLLIQHGEDDPQVPPYESAQFVEALKKNGKWHRYFTYPGEGHGFRRREHRLDAWKKQLAFLSKYLEPPFGQSITSTEDMLLEKERKP